MDSLKELHADRGWWVVWNGAFTFDGRRYESGVIVIFNDGSRRAMTVAQWRAWLAGVPARRVAAVAGDVDDVVVV